MPSRSFFIVVLRCRYGVHATVHRWDGFGACIFILRVFSGAHQCRYLQHPNRGAHSRIPGLLRGWYRTHARCRSGRFCFHSVKLLIRFKQLRLWAPGIRSTQPLFQAMRCKMPHFWLVYMLGGGPAILALPSIMRLSKLLGRTSKRCPCRSSLGWLQLSDLTPFASTSAYSTSVLFFLK